MNNLKRVICLALTLVMLLSYAPTAVFATGEEISEVPVSTEPVPVETEEPVSVAEEPAPEVTEEPAPEVTEEPAPEVTEEPAPEATEEPAPEVTEEPAPEATEEPAPEVTEEPAPEVTEAPAAEPAEEEVITEYFESGSIDMDMPSNDELFAGYVENVMYDSFSAAYGTAGRARLTSAEKGIYDKLKTVSQSIAANGGSTEFTLTGLSSISGLDVTVSSTSDFYNQFNFRQIIMALLSDLPYDLYWFDKTIGWSYGCSYSYSSGTYTIVSLKVNLYVAEAYRSSYSNDLYVTSSVSKVNTAKANAKAIANSASGSAYSKMVYFRDAICARNTYNYDAVNYNYAYGDPWQLIYVFDGDSSTNVVCEGYSKAFQYLCDLSGLTCYIVTGDMYTEYGNGGAHMWNLVTLGGKRYMVDVTNSDEGSYGVSEGLFLAGSSRGSVSGGYTFTNYGTDIYYYYDDDTINLWGTSILTLASSDYDPSTAIISVGTPTVTVKANTPTALKVTWTTATNADYYQVYRSTSANGTYTLVGTYSSGVRSITNSGLTTGTKYYYKVRGYASQDGEKFYGSYSSAVGLTAKPVAPTAKIAVNTPTSLKVSWNRVSGASYYQVYRSTSANGTYKLLGVYTSSTTSKIDTGLSTGTKYYYKVRAYTLYNDLRVTGDYSNVVSATAQPAAPTVNVTPYSTSSLKISWSKVTGASYYQVYRSTSSNGTYTLLGVYSSSTTSKIDTGLSLGTKYYYKVRAYTLVGETRVTGPYGTDYATVRPPAPTGVKAVTGSSSGSVNVTWNGVSGATYYEVYRSNTGTGNWVLLGTYSSTTRSKLSTALTSGSTYYYKVRCYRLVDGNRYFSDFSSVVSARAK